MTRTLALLALGLLLLGTAHANPPVPVVVPYYGATYGTPGGFSAADAKRVVELLESIDRRLAAIEERTGGPVPIKAKGPDLTATARTHCAACHTPAKADGSGGGFILFAADDGKALKPLSGREKTRVAEAVQAGTMPPADRKKLTAAEKAAFKW
jgi:hypothetical protein